MKSISSVARSIDAFFANDSPIHHTLASIDDRFSQLQLPYAVIGGMAVYAHGYNQTTGDLDLLMRPGDLERFKGRWLGAGYRLQSPEARGMVDEENDVGIDVVYPGQFPGDRRPKPVCFPEPTGDMVVQLHGYPTLCLPKLIEVKLASGMTAEDRIGDYSHVLQLMVEKDLPNSFRTQLHPYVHPAWDTYWPMIPKVRQDRNQ